MLDLNSQSMNEDNCCARFQMCHLIVVVSSSQYVPAVRWLFDSALSNCRLGPELQPALSGTRRGFSAGQRY